MRDDIQRLFVAVKLPYPQYGAELVAQVRNMGVPVYPVRPDNAHVTLKFIGNTPAEAVDRISLTLGECLASFQIFKVSFADIGTFGSRRTPRVLWIGIEDGGMLGQMAVKMDAALVSCGIRPDVHSFSPHLTLGRFKGRGGRPPKLTPMQADMLEKVLSGPMEEEAKAFTIDHVVLERSILGPGGPTYHEVHRVDLQEAGIFKVPDDTL